MSSSLSRVRERAGVRACRAHLTTLTLTPTLSRKR